MRVAADERELALARGEHVRHEGAEDGGQNERGGFEEMAPEVHAAILSKLPAAAARPMWRGTRISRSRACLATEGKPCSEKTQSRSRTTVPERPTSFRSRAARSGPSTCA